MLDVQKGDDRMENIKDIIELIKKDKNCKLVEGMSDFASDLNIPEDLKFFYDNYDSIELFLEKPYGIRIVSINEFISTNKNLYSEGDVIWEELEGDISNQWYMIAESEQLSQYVSLDMGDSNLGYCYDSFLETHATPGDSPIIAKSFTELLKRLYFSGGEKWYWLEENFEPYGDAYSENI